MNVPQSAMVLAAGLGKRMRPITDHLAKPLVEIAGRTLLDRGLDTLAEAGVSRAVVNTHHLGGQIAAHLRPRTHPAITISDESERLLDSAGGIVKALPLLGPGPFVVLNADTFWIGDQGRNLRSLAACWDEAKMDILLLLASPGQATGHSGKLDFVLSDDGALRRAGTGEDGHIYAGAAIVHPRVFTGAPEEPHSLNLYFDRAIAQRRLHGCPMEGSWITVGTPDAIPLAERALAEAAASAP